MRSFIILYSFKSLSLFLTIKGMYMFLFYVLCLNRKPFHYLYPILSFLIMVILLLVIRSNHVFALEPVILSNEDVEYPLGLSLEYLEDKGKSLTIEDVISQRFSQQFRHCKQNTLDLGLTQSNIWVRFSLKNNSAVNQKWLLEIALAAIGNIEFYTPDERHGFDIRRTGYLQPLDKREKMYRFFIFALPNLTQEAKTFYLCFNSQDSIAIPMSIMTQERFYKKDYLRQYLIGIYYGIMLVMILYNIFIYISLKDRSYLYYVLYFLSFMMVQSYNDGIFYGYVLTELMGFDVQIQCVFIAVTLFWGTIFTITFLHTAQYLPFFDRILRLILKISVVLALMSLFISANTMLMILFIFILILIPILLISGTLCLIRGYSPARFYLIASFLFLTGVALQMLADLSIIPMDFLSMHGMRIGSAFDVTLLSLALADRINVMQSENVEFKLQAEAETAKSQRLESIALLAGGMAHDLNNILSGLLIKVQLSLGIIKKDPEMAAGYLSDVKNVFNMAKNILNRLQTFSSGNALKIKQGSLSKLLSEAGNIVLCGSNSQCELTILHELLPVNFDQTQFNQVITNILINADQAMPNGGKIDIIAENAEITDNIPSLPIGKYIKITIKDTGIGIPKENINKIFDPFFTTKENGQGLGLATSYSIIKKHNGYIEVESKIDKGTNVYIYLPCSKEEQRILTEEEIISDDRKLLGKTILVMDDNETLLESITAILSDKGCIIDVARNGDEAISLYQKGLNSEEPYDILLIDVTISGGMGGITAIKQLREIDPKVKAIVSSGYSEIPVMSNFRQYGFVAALPKPYTVEELLFVLSDSI